MKKIASLLLAVMFALLSSVIVYADTNGDNSAVGNTIIISGTDYVESSDAELSADDSSFERNVLVWKNEKGTVKYKFTSPASDKYYLRLYYGTIEGSGSDIRVGIKIDGEYPFEAAEEICFKRCFENVGGIRSDKAGNQFAPAQGERFGLYDDYAMDSLGRQSDPFEFSISEGEHTLEIVAIDEPFAIEKIVFETPKDVITYKEYKNIHSDKSVYNGKEIMIQGENADYKSASYLVPLADMSDVSL
ncbi:MAG: hypothetical protein J5766_02065, partial [Clostridia bacterium]|nr:hypothetical protein [Clostridia bacterium]